MNWRFEKKTLNALGWIIGILNSNKINYQISGGFAGKIFGSQRKLHDIDIDIHEKDFNKIKREVSNYITYGPSRYKDAKWDIELITLSYKGQEIDISGVETMKISNKRRTKWITFPVDFSNALNVSLNGLKIKIINPNNFIKYKKELDGIHQTEDIKMAKNYLVNHAGNLEK